MIGAQLTAAMPLPSPAVPLTLFRGPNSGAEVSATVTAKTWLTALPWASTADTLHEVLPAGNVPVRVPATRSTVTLGQLAVTLGAPPLSLAAIGTVTATPRPPPPGSGPRVRLALLPSTATELCRVSTGRP